jgi:predicted GH43/DUF377 family glycosyl hydrolase
VLFRSRELKDASREPFVIDEFVSPELERHDPSNIIKYNDKYYIWFTEHPKSTSWHEGSAFISYATSVDGYGWKIHGPVLAPPQSGSWDEKGAITAYVVPEDGKYYLFYTGGAADFIAGQSKTGIGYAVADTPDGPWKRCDTPILWPSDDEWEYLRNDDTNIIFWKDKWWLYFKGKPRNGDPRATKIGLAVSDNLIGPYKKHPENPLFGGHALTTWVHRDGVAALTGFGVHGKLLWSEDGVHFVKVKNFRNQSTGLYCPQNFENRINSDGVTWGFDVEIACPRFIYRFNTNMIPA